MDSLDDLPLPLRPFPPYSISSFFIHSPPIVTPRDASSYCTSVPVVHIRHVPDW